jgi:hypothetical protein
MRQHICSYRNSSGAILFLFRNFPKAGLKIDEVFRVTLRRWIRPEQFMSNPLLHVAFDCNGIYVPQFLRGSIPF